MTDKEPEKGKSEFVAFHVEEQVDGDLQYHIAARGFKNTEEVQRWKRTKGLAGCHYQPGRLTGEIETVEVTSETVETRKLVPYKAPVNAYTRTSADSHE